MKDLSELYFQSMGGTLQGFEMFPSMPITVEELIGKPWKVYTGDGQYVQFYWTKEHGVMLGQVGRDRSLLAEAAYNERGAKCIIKPEYTFTFTTEKGKVNVVALDFDSTESTEAIVGILKLERHNQIFNLMKVKTIRFWTYHAITRVRPVDGWINVTHNDDSSPHYYLDVEELSQICEWL